MINGRKTLYVIAVFLFSFAGILSADDTGISTVPRAGNAIPPEFAAETLVESPATFREIWGYLQSGEEKLLNPSYPVSDIGHFGATVNYRGKLYGVPDRKRLQSFKGRVHLVVAEVTNQALTHFCLDPAFHIRNELISSIITASKGYDGVQIDFELVPASDSEHFYSFLSALKAKLGSRTLSVAIPARTRNVGDAFDYRRVAKIADRVIVMAYDEHWSGSAPGSIASLPWCRKVAEYALSTIGPEKLVMGLPFYGRAWAEQNHSKAYRYSGISRLLSEKNVSSINRDDSVPSFSYQELVTVNVFYEDSHSIVSRAQLYRDVSVGAIAFWKIGQEDGDVWNRLALAP